MVKRKPKKPKKPKKPGQEEAAKLRQPQPRPKSPPPEVIYMIIGNKPIRLRLCHQHNMPVYLPDIEELP